MGDGLLMAGTVETGWAPASFSQDIQPLQTAWGPLASSLHFAICFYHFLFFLILRLLLAV